MAEERQYLGYPLGEADLPDRDWEPAMQAPVIRSNLGYKVANLAVIEPSGTPGGLMVCCEVPGVYNDSHITLRWSKEEGYAAAILIDGAWYRQRVSFYVPRDDDETDSDVIERLGLSEETLLPGHPRE